MFVQQSHSQRAIAGHGGLCDIAVFIGYMPPFKAGSQSKTAVAFYFVE
jgi:hypothetical protein